MTTSSFTEALVARMHELMRERERLRGQRNRQRKRAELWKQRYEDAVRSRAYHTAYRQRWAKEKRR